MEYEKLTDAEMDILADEHAARNPYLKRILESEAVLLRARYIALVDQGFTAEQALEIIKARGSNV